MNQILHIIIVSIAVGLPTLLIIFLSIAVLCKEKYITELRCQLFHKDKEIRNLQETVQQLSGMFPDDIQQLLQQNETLQVRIKDLKNLRELDGQARERLSQENEQLHGKITAYAKIQELVQQIMETNNEL